MNIGRRKRSYQNIAMSLASELILVLVGFMLPRALMSNYSSEVNGAITSLQQIIGYFALVEAGLSGAAVYSLYKPLAKNDTDAVSTIMTSAKRLYNRYGTVYMLLLVSVGTVYPLVVNRGGFSYRDLFLLFVLIGVNGATQLLFIGKYKVLLMASQRGGYVSLINALSSAVFSLIIIGLSFTGMTVVAAVSIAVTAYLLRAVAFRCVASRIFQSINFSKSGKLFVFPQQRDVLAQQILSLLVMNSGVLVLLLFGAPFARISVYTTYNYVFSSVVLLLNTINIGISAGFGDLIAKNKPDRLSAVYKEYEALFQALWSVVITCMFVLYVPFITVYTADITDINYVSPLLAVLFTVNCGLWVIRNQQSVMIVSAGKFREIRRSSIVEAILAIVGSAIGWMFFGLVGLMAGRLVASMYRAVDFVYFNSRYVVATPLRYTVRQIALSVVSVLLSLIILMLIPPLFHGTYLTWILQAALCVTVACITTTAVRLVGDRAGTMAMIKKLSVIRKH